jgi:hypothetical protein
VKISPLLLPRVVVLVKYALRAKLRQEDDRLGLVWHEGDTIHAEEPNAGFWMPQMMDLLSGSRLEDLL